MVTSRKYYHLLFSFSLRAVTKNESSLRVWPCFQLLCDSEETDKVYFRKKDEMSDYAEAYFKSRIIISNKWLDITKVLLA